MNRLSLYFIAVSFAVFFSCGKENNVVAPEEDIEDLGDKYVLVHCVIHAQYPDWPESELNTYGQKMAMSEYSREPDLQHLYLCYNTLENGKPEKLESAVPVLYNEVTGAKIGTYERVSDYEWQLRFLPTGNVVDDSHKRYTIKYRLEITDIPGKDKITAVAEFDKEVSNKYFTISDNTYLESGRLFHALHQKEESNTNAWLFADTYERIADWGPYGQIIGIPIPYKSVNRFVTSSSLCTNYPSCDSFNYDRANERYPFAIRLNDYNKKEKSGDFYLSLSPFIDGFVSIGDIDYFKKTELTINYVSDSYDKFLKTGIIYCVNNNIDITAQEGLPIILPNKSISSNIKGGLGVFGIQIASFINDTWSNTGIL